MKKSQLPFMPNFFDRYINKVDDTELIGALEKHSFQSMFSIEKLKALGDRVYAENKWTVRDVFQHMLDTERIMAYRALRIARGDKTPLPGFEENDYAKEATAHRRSLENLMEEAETLRKSSIALFKSFTDEMLLREGISSNQKISVLALGFVVVGHPLHHADVIKERYYPLLG